MVHQASPWFISIDQILPGRNALTKKWAVLDGIYKRRRDHDCCKLLFHSVGVLGPQIATDGHRTTSKNSWLPMVWWSGVSSRAPSDCAARRPCILKGKGLFQGSWIQFFFPIRLLEAKLGKMEGLGGHRDCRNIIDVSMKPVTNPAPCLEDTTNIWLLLREEQRMPCHP